MIYENLIKVYGPYKPRKSDRRVIVVLKFSDGTTKGTQYARYLMKLYLDRYLLEDETVDHIDGDPTNNSIENLRVVDRNVHCTNDVLRNKDVIVKCTYCGKEFTIKGGLISNRNRKDRYQSGYFCSRSCSGKYGKEIQQKKRFHIITPKIKTEKFQLKSALDRNTNVEEG